MSEHRCPMCGRENPTYLDICQYCQARLKPVQSSSSAEAGGVQDEKEKIQDEEGVSEGRELGEWLRSLRPEESGKTEPVSEPGSVDLSSGREIERSVEDTGLGDRGEEDQDSTPDLITAGDKIPDWLEKVSGMSLDEPSGIKEGEPFEEREDALPDWLAEFVTTSSELTDETRPQGESEEETEHPLISKGEGGVEPLEPGELPDWFRQFTVESGPSEEGDVEDIQGSEEQLTPTTLPSWVEAMRPVEAAAPPSPKIDLGEERVERAGPLSGLKGVLPAEPEIARTPQPPKRSTSLQVSESQQNHAELLKRMLEEEGVPRSIPVRIEIVSHNSWRWIIAAIMIGSILWSLLANTNADPLPAFSHETLAANRLINGLPPQAQVLLAFDYEPGLSPEMDAIAEVVIDHLMLRSVYLTLVSTSPVGPLVGERLISTTLSHHNYTRNQQYVNLGYLPGGPTGLLGFVNSPERALPFTFDSLAAWGSEGRLVLAPLIGIQGVNDYSMVIVISDNPDTARVWVEQVGRRLQQSDRPTPLVMVLSAQAEPLIRPYYQSSPQQVQGMVTGVRGGAGYANLTGRDGLARTYWNTYGVGLGLAALILTVGSMISAYGYLITPRSPNGGEEGR